MTLLHEYSETELDEWDRLQLQTSRGPVYVRIDRSLVEPGYRSEQFRVVDGED